MKKLKSNGYLFASIILIIFFNNISTKNQEINDIFLSLEKEFNCQIDNNKINFKEINYSNEEQIFEGENAFLLYVTATWCDYCCQETKILSYIQNYLFKSKNNLLNKIKIYELKSNEYNNIIKKYKIFLTKIPSLYLIKNTQEIIQYSSYFKKKDILNFIEKNISPIKVLNSINETKYFINSSKIKIKLIGYFQDKNINEYYEFIKYSNQIKYRFDVEIKVSFDENISLYLKQKDKENALDEYSTNFLFLKRYNKIYFLDINLKKKYLKDFIYYNTFSALEEISDNNRNIIMNIKTPMALFFIDSTYNLNNYHKVFNYLEKLSYDFDLKYIFTFMDGGVKTDFKKKLGLDDKFPSLVIHHFDNYQGIKFPMKEQEFNNKNIRKFLEGNLINNNKKKENNKIIKNKNKEIFEKLKGIEFLDKNRYNDVLFKKENKKDLLLFIIDEYSFDSKEIIFSNKIKNIKEIIDDYGIDFYIDIFWISINDLFEYKSDVKNEIFRFKTIEFLLNSKIVLKNENLGEKNLYMKKFKKEIEKEYNFILWIKEYSINKFEIPKKENYYEELYKKYENILNNFYNY